MEEMLFCMGAPRKPQAICSFWVVACL